MLRLFNDSKDLYVHDKKLIISVGQALLVLAYHYKDDSLKLKKIQKLYLTGNNNPKNKASIINLLSDPILKEYKISKKGSITNNDFSRRRFESDLAY